MRGVRAALQNPLKLTRYERYRAATQRLGGRLDDAQMRRLNAQVDIERRDPAEVARTYLRETGLVNGS